MQQIRSGKNDTKMIKRDWKLPNPSFFTYTSIVQPVLQANNPFLQADSLFSQFLQQFSSYLLSASNLLFLDDKNDKKRLEIAKSILFHIHKHCTTIFTSLQPIFTSKQALFTVLNAPNLKREKRLQNGTKWLDLPPQAPPIL